MNPIQPAMCFYTSYIWSSYNLISSHNPGHGSLRWHYGRIINQFATTHYLAPTQVWKYYTLSLRNIAIPACCPNCSLEDHLGECVITCYIQTWITSYVSQLFLGEGCMKCYVQTRLNFDVSQLTQVRLCALHINLPHL